jgi:hypothetical protein
MNRRCGNKAPNILKLSTNGNEWSISLAALSFDVSVKYENEKYN